MHMKRILLSTSLLIGLGPLGCSKPQFTYYVPPGTSVQKFETIAIDPRTDYAFIIEGKRQLRDLEVQGLVLAELQAKGYRLAPPDQADLWVNVVLLIKAFQSNAGYSGGHGSHGGGASSGHGGMGHGGHSSGLDASSHGDGSSHSGSSDTTVLVQLVTRPSLERIWFGTGVVKPTKDASGHHGDQPLSDTVKRLLDPLQARSVANRETAMD